MPSSKTSDKKVEEPVTALNSETIFSTAGTATGPTDVTSQASYLYNNPIWYPDADSAIDSSYANVSVILNNPLQYLARPPAATYYISTTPVYSSPNDALLLNKYYLKDGENKLSTSFLRCYMPQKELLMQDTNNDDTELIISETSSLAIVKKTSENNKVVFLTKDSENAYRRDIYKAEVNTLPISNYVNNHNTSTKISPIIKSANYYVNTPASKAYNNEGRPIGLAIDSTTETIFSTWGFGILWNADNDNEYVNESVTAIDSDGIVLWTVHADKVSNFLHIPVTCFTPYAIEYNEDDSELYVSIYSLTGVNTSMPVLLVLNSTNGTIKKAIYKSSSIDYAIDLAFDSANKLLYTLSQNRNQISVVDFGNNGNNGKASIYIDDVNALVPETPNNYQGRVTSVSIAFNDYDSKLYIGANVSAIFSGNVNNELKSVVYQKKGMIFSVNTWNDGVTLRVKPFFIFERPDHGTLTTTTTFEPENIVEGGMDIDNYGNIYVLTNSYENSDHTLKIISPNTFYFRSIVFVPKNPTNVPTTVQLQVCGAFSKKTPDNSSFVPNVDDIPNINKHVINYVDPDTLAPIGLINCTPTKSF